MSTSSMSLSLSLPGLLCCIILGDSSLEIGTRAPPLSTTSDAAIPISLAALLELADGNNEVPLALAEVPAASDLMGWQMDASTIASSCFSPSAVGPLFFSRWLSDDSNMSMGNFASLSEGTEVSYEALNLHNKC